MRVWHGVRGLELAGVWARVAPSRCNDHWGTSLPGCGSTSPTSAELRACCRYGRASGGRIDQREFRDHGPPPSAMRKFSVPPPPYTVAVPDALHPMYTWDSLWGACGLHVSSTIPRPRRCPFECHTSMRRTPCPPYTQAGRGADPFLEVYEWSSGCSRPGRAEERCLRSGIGRGVVMRYAPICAHTPALGQEWSQGRGHTTHCREPQ